jgi:hypothetical protein
VIVVADTSILLNFGRVGQIAPALRSRALELARE